MRPRLVFRARPVLSAALAATVLGLGALGCNNPTPVRGAEVEGLDDPAMSTGLDKRDLQQLMHDNMKAFVDSPLVAEWTQQGIKPQVAIYPLANETSEHIDSQLDALLSDIETYLVNSNKVTVISVERQRQMMNEIAKQQGGGFDPSKVAEVNRQLGAEFYITGKVFTSDERSEGERRVQYFMFVQVIDVATSAVRFQHKSELTKGIIDT